MQHLQPGTTLQNSKYRIERVLGQGGFGITYLATQPLMLDRRLAIKEFFLKDYFSRDEATAHVTCSTASNRDMAAQYKKKFIMEAQTLLRISHPYLVKVLDIFEENDTAYYVMEYAEGPTLSDVIKEQGPLAEDVAVGYVLKVAEVLDFLHGKKVTHLDVKPSNIILCAPSSSADETNISTEIVSAEIKLIDFGASKHYDAQGGGQTTIATPCYSPGYAPIEQYKKGGVDTFSPQSDIYALGATLYKLLTGVKPPEPSELVSYGLQGFPAGLSATTKGTILMAMQLAREDRPQTIAEFVDYLTGKKEIPLRGVVCDVDDEETQVNAPHAAAITQLQNELKEKQAALEEMERNVSKEKTVAENLAKQLAEAKGSVEANRMAWIFFLVAALALGAGCAYFYTQNSELMTAKSKTQTENRDKSSRIAYLENQNKELSSQVEQQKSTLNTLNGLLEKFGSHKLIITDVSVCNDGEAYGATIYSRNTTYIYPKITLTSLIDADVDIYVKFFTPYGLSQGSSSPSGYSYNTSVNVDKYSTWTYELTGWGGTDKGHWDPGNYRFEFYYAGNLIGKKSFTIY